jgi:hypothetical protein
MAASHDRELRPVGGGEVRIGLGERRLKRWKRILKKIDSLPK